MSVTGQTYAASHVSKFHSGKKATVTAQFEMQSTSALAGWVPSGNEIELSRTIPAIWQLGITTTTWAGTLTARADSSCIARSYAAWFMRCAGSSTGRRV